MGRLCQARAGADCVREAGGEVVVLDFQDGFSTSSMIDRIREAEE